MGNPFFGTPLFRTKHSGKIRTVTIKHFIKKLLSDLVPDLGRCPNHNTHEIRKYMYLRAFWFRHFLRSRIKSKSIFFYKVLYNYCSTFFLETFCLKKLRSKKWISHCIVKKRVLSLPYYPPALKYIEV